MTERPDTPSQAAPQPDPQAATQPDPRAAPQPDPEAATQPGEPNLAEATRLAALNALLDRMIPLLESFSEIDPADGGPNAEDLALDPQTGRYVLPEAIEAERLLASTDEDGLALGPIDDLDAPDPHAQATPQPAPSGDDLLDAARVFIAAVESLRAHRIAGMDTHASEQRALIARGALVYAARADATPALDPVAAEAQLAALAASGHADLETGDEIGDAPDPGAPNNDAPNNGTPAAEAPAGKTQEDDASSADAPDGNLPDDAAPSADSVVETFDETPTTPDTPRSGAGVAR